MRKILAMLLLLVLCLSILSGCHGSRGLPVFEIPESFDTSRDYEITFWAKNDTNITQVEIYEKAETLTKFRAQYMNVFQKLKARGEQIEIIDASGNIEQTAEAINKAIFKHFGI